MRWMRAPLPLASASSCFPTATGRIGLRSRLGPDVSTPRPILVTGATGLIGRRVVASLLRHGEAPIVVLVRDPARWQTLAPRFGSAASRVTAVRADITRSALGIDLKATRRFLGAPS